MANNSVARRTCFDLWSIVNFLVGTLRLAAFTPAAMYYYAAKSHWQLINSHAQLNSGLYGTTIVTAEKIATKWGKVGFFWSIAIWIPAICLPWFFSVPVAVVDSVIAAYIATATHYQFGFVPLSQKTCATAAYEWHKPNGANETFFQAAARLNATVASPVQMCKDFVQESYFGLVNSVLFSLLGLGGILSFISTIWSVRREGQSFFERSLKEAYFVIFFVPTVVGMILKLVATFLLWLLYMLPAWLFRYLPHGFISKVRFGRACVLKGGLGAEQKVELTVMEFKHSHEQSKKQNARYKCGEGIPSPLSKFLDTYDMLMAVTEHLHYSDMISLGRTSKSLRNAVFPYDFVDQREAAYERYTCDVIGRAKCWLCDRQICSYCHQLPLVEHGPYYQHLESCRPYCSSCYHSTILLSPLTQERKQITCTCGPTISRINDFFHTVNKLSRRYMNRQTQTAKSLRSVCRDCNMFSSQELAEKRESKTRRLLMEGRNLDGREIINCSRPECCKALGTGPRWWVCKHGCGKECKSIVHKGWGRNVKSASDTVGTETA